MKKDIGPLLYDSLDRPNANVNRPQSQQRTEQVDWRTIAVILFFGTCVLGAVFVYVVASLRYAAYIEYNQQALLLLQILHASVVIAFIIFMFGAIYAAIGWLIRWARKNGILSLHEGPHYDVMGVTTKHYDELFASFADQFMRVLEERAKQSTYQGATTITISEGDTTTNTTYKETKPAQQDTLVSQETIQEPKHTMTDLDKER